MRWFALPVWFLSTTFFLGNCGLFPSSAYSDDSAGAGQTQVERRTSLRQPLSAFEFSSTMRPAVDSQAPLPDAPESGDGLAQSGPAVQRPSETSARKLVTRSPRTTSRSLRLFSSRSF